MLNVSGSNLLELCILFPDTAIKRQWHILIDDTKVLPWPYQAVRAVFLSKKPSPRPHPDYMDLGRFKILQRRTLSPEELVFWDRSQVLDVDSNMPEEIEVPIGSMYENSGRIQSRADIKLNKQPGIAYLPGDTVTFFLFPDSNYHAMTFRMLKEERFEDMIKLGWFARAEWPLANQLPGMERFMRLNPAMHPHGVSFYEVLGLGYTVVPDIDHSITVERVYWLDSSGALSEKVPVPNDFDSGTLLLHYRNFHEGIAADTTPTQALHVYIDSSGKGVSGSNGIRRSFQLSESELSELLSLLNLMPNPLPNDWERQYFEKQILGRDLDSTRFLFTGNRGMVVKLSAERFQGAFPPAEQKDLVLRVDAWLRERGFL